MSCLYAHRHLIKLEEKVSPLERDYGNERPVMDITSFWLAYFNEVTAILVEMQLLNVKASKRRW